MSVAGYCARSFCILYSCLKIKDKKVLFKKLLIIILFYFFKIVHQINNKDKIYIHHYILRFF